MSNIIGFQQFVKDHTWRNKDIFFTSNALGGELGELQNVIKKEIAAQDFPNYATQVFKREQNGAPTFREMFVDEAGDVLFYFLQMLNKKDVSIIEVINGQVDKINKQSAEAGTLYLK